MLAALALAVQVSLSLFVVLALHLDSDDARAMKSAPLDEPHANNYSRDFVTTVPFAFGYSSLPRAILFRPEDTQAVIKQNIPCSGRGRVSR